MSKNLDISVYLYGSRIGEACAEVTLTDPNTGEELILTNEDMSADDINLIRKLIPSASARYVRQT